MLSREQILEEMGLWPIRRLWPDQRQPAEAQGAVDEAPSAVGPVDGESPWEMLEREIADLRTDLRTAGLDVDAAPSRRGRRGARSTPRNDPAGFTTEQDHGASFAVRFTRTGEAPVIRPSAVVSTGGCGHRIELPDLKRISDFQLTQRGRGKSSPLRLEVDGVELRPHGFPKAFETCTGSFRHAGTVVLFAPASEAADLSAIRLHFDGPFPSADAQGTPRYWLHPGQRAELVTEGAWDEAWGEARLVLEVDGPPPRITVDGEPAGIGDPLPGVGPWTIRLDPSDHTSIDLLAIGNPQHAVLVVAP